MKRFSRRWFAQIMINKLLKKELELLKPIMKKEYNYDYNLSYGDVITILLDNYKKKKLEFNLEPKFTIAMPFSGQKGISVAYKLNQTTTK